MHLLKKTFLFVFAASTVFFFYVPNAEANYFCPTNMAGRDASACFEFPDGASYEQRLPAQTACQNQYGQGACTVVSDPAAAAAGQASNEQSIQAASTGFTYGCTGVTASLCIAFYDALYWVISLPITLAGLYLYFAGTLFDHSIAFTITSFSANYNAYFAQGVDSVWASFRDVGNIVMIGVFVYIAFRVILNVESLQMKGFAARLIIVAVLINFSLFFAKVIIDISNITATQFLRGTTTSVVDEFGNNPHSISATFADRAGMKGVFFESAADVVRSIGNKDNADMPNGSTLRYIILTTIFFLAVGSVLLYGAILLISRMIALILLMITSSLAWVSFMTPKLDKFWGMWWDKMFKYALFAPLYMLLIWATLKITETLGAVGGGAQSANSQSFVTLTTSGSIFTATIKVAFIVGLLYGATKIADELAIYGAKSAKSISMRAFGMGLSMTGGGYALAAGERLAQSIGKATAERASKVNESLYRRTGGLVGSARLDAQLDKMKKKSAELSLASTALGKNIGLQTPHDKHKAEDAFEGKMRIADAKKDLQKMVSDQEKMSQEQKNKPRDEAAQAVGESGDGGAKDIKNVMEQGAKEQARATADAIRSANAGKQEEVQTLRAKLTGAQAAGDGGAVRTIERAIKQKEGEITAGTQKISDLASKLQEIERAELRAASTAETASATSAPSAGGGGTAPKESSKIEQALAALKAQGQKQYEQSIKKQNMDTELAKASRQLAEQQLEWDMANSSSKEDKEHYGRILKEIKKAGRDDTTIALDTLKEALSKKPDSHAPAAPTPKASAPSASASAPKKDDHGHGGGDHH